MAEDDSFVATVTRISLDSDHLLPETLVVEVKAGNVDAVFLFDVGAIVVHEMLENRIAMLAILNQKISIVMFVKFLQKRHSKDLLHKSVE